MQQEKTYPHLVKPGAYNSADSSKQSRRPVYDMLPAVARQRRTGEKIGQTLVIDM